MRNEDFEDIYANLGIIFHGDILKLREVKVAIARCVKEYDIEIVYQKSSLNRLFILEENQE